MLFWLYIIFFLYYIFSIYKKHGFNSSCFILSIYLVGAINCLIIYSLYPSYIKHPERITIDSVLAHITLLWLFFYPLFNYGNTLKVENICMPERIIRILSFILITTSCIAILFALKDIGQILVYKDLGAARYAATGGEFSQNYVKNYGIIGIIPAFGANSSLISLFLSLYLKFYKKNHPSISNLLFISSLAMPLNNLTSVGRDGFVRWILFLIFCAIILKKYIKIREHKKFLFTLSSILVIIIIIFANITTDRFDKKNFEYGPIFSLLRYGGEQFYLFSYGFHRFFYDGMTDIQHLFPLLTNLDFDIFRLNKRFVADYFLNTFPTFVGSFVMYLGFYNALFLCLSAFFGGYLLLWKEKRYQKVSSTKMMIYLFYSEIVIAGFFYFFHGGKMAQLVITSITLISYLGSKFSLNKTVKNRICARFE